MIQHAILHAASDPEGKLPLVLSGEVKSLPGENWSTWRAVIHQSLRNFDVPELKGFPDLYRYFGLMIGESQNSIKVNEAIQNILETGHHGLSPNSEQKLDENFALKCILHFAERSEGKLPTERTPGFIQELPGVLWPNFSLMIAKRRNGFTRKGIKSLSHFCEIWGLKFGRKENPIAIKAAIESLRDTGHHGLKIVEVQKLSRDFILMNGLLYAKSHGLCMPDINSGELDGFPGQEWKQLHNAIINCQRGFDQEGLKGLKSFFFVYGLMRIEVSGKRFNFSNDPDAIQAAIDRLETYRHHGLKPINEQAYKKITESSEWYKNLHVPRKRRSTASPE